MILLLTVVLSTGPSAAQSKRVALVIGNSDYKHTPRLINPKNDASDMAAVLRKLGFAATEMVDLDKAAMDRAIRDFAEGLSGAQAGLFFYAGHGLQVGGQNYLVPIDAKLTTASAIDFEMVRLELVHRTMEREASTNILIMDACRDNPLARNLARALGTRSIQVGRGLAPVESGVGTLISFSTQPGNVALDGTGRNSPFAAALVKHLVAPKEDLGGLLIDVRNDVMKETQNKQIPWEHSALTGRFFFSAPVPVVAPAAASPVPSAAARLSEAAEAWDRTKDATSAAVLEAFAARYKDTFYTDLARARIDELAKQAAATEAAKTMSVLARNLQRELARVGCDPGAVDGKWGTKASEALNEFARLTKSTIPNDDPSDAALAAVSGQKGRICPLRCGANQREVNGSCVANAPPKIEKNRATVPSRPKFDPSASCWPRSGGTGNPVPCDDPLAGQRIR